MSGPGPVWYGSRGAALEGLRIVAILAWPAVPGACAEISRRIGLPDGAEEERLPESIEWGGYPAGLPVVKGEPLFPRLK